MLKFRALGEVSEKIARNCHNIKIPLCNVECSYNHSRMNHNMNQWFFAEQRRKLRAEKIKQMNNTFQITKKLNLLPDYGSKKISNDVSRPVNYITTEKYKRISPELLDLLQDKNQQMTNDFQVTKKLNLLPDYGSKKTSNDVSRPVNYITTEKYLQQDKNPKLKVNIAQPRNLQPRNNIQECDTVQLDNTNPRLASYLRDTMKNNDSMNIIYDIDFSSKFNNAAFKCIPDPFDIANTLTHLLAGGALDPIHLMNLRNFLEYVVKLNPEDLADFLKKLQAQGYLTPELQDLLGKLILQATLNLEDSEKSQIFSVFEDCGIKNFENSSKGLGEIFQSLIEPKLNYASYKYQREAKHVSYHRESLVDPLSTSEENYKKRRLTGILLPNNKITEDDMDVKYKYSLGFEQNYVKRPSFVPAKQYAGVRKDGYYEPWNDDVRMSDPKSIFQMANIGRKSSRIDFKHFNFTRGLEKYRAERQHKREQEERLKEEARMQRSNADMRGTFSKSRFRGLEGKKSRIRTLPSFMLPVKSKNSSTENWKN